MAASHAPIPLSRPPFKSPSVSNPQQNARSVRLVLGFRRILLRLACPRHAWNWPRLIPGESHQGFDAHQTCFKCNTERFYNSRLLKPGPLYRVRTAEPEESPARPWAKLLAFPASAALGARLRMLARWGSPFAGALRATARSR
jgi:hypothetical protein